MKILLADDATFIRMSLEKILDNTEFDFEYIEAGDGIEAVEKYKICSPDLVIMDISMPNMDGISLGIFDSAFLLPGRSTPWQFSRALKVAFPPAFSFVMSELLAQSPSHTSEGLLARLPPLPFSKNGYIFSAP